MKKKIYTLKKEYFKLSESNKLPKRCPLIGYCERYASSIFYLSEFDVINKRQEPLEILKNEGLVPNDYEKKEIKQIGAPFTFSKSSETCSVYNSCPEVPLFINSLIFGFIPQKPIVSGFWDNLWSENHFGTDGKFQIHKLGHYSECSEFSSVKFKKRKTNSSRRIPISQKLRFEIFKRDNFTCFYCNKNKDDDKIKLTIDHRVPIAEGGSDDIENLITSCEDCNSGKSNKLLKGVNI